MSISKGFRYKDKEGKVTDYEYGVNGSNVTQDANHRLVTDEEKKTWNGKADPEDIPSGSAASYSVANNDTTTQAGFVADARIVKQHGDEIDQLSQNLQELQEGMMKIATKTVTVTTGNGGSTYQNEIDLNDMGLDISKIIACYFEPTNAGIGLTSTGGGQCTLAKNYNTATGILTISIGSTTYCRPMTWTGTVIAITA